MFSSRPLPSNFGVYRLPLPPSTSREEVVRHNREMLSRALHLRTTVAFVGAGLPRCCTTADRMDCLVGRR